LQAASSFSVNGWNTFRNLSAPIPLVVKTPADIAGSRTNTATLLFAPVDTPGTANVVYARLGCPRDDYLANPSGQIAPIDRGTCAVGLKIDAAARVGSTGVPIGLVRRAMRSRSSMVEGRFLSPRRSSPRRQAARLRMP
jgi:hypothetical protein